MRAYYFDNLPGDQRLPHDYIPSRPVSSEALEAHNIKFWHIPLEEYESKVEAIATERGYTNRELTDVSKEGFGEVSYSLKKIYICQWLIFN
jgi:1,2-dihydroxy-3-keto-5-methylthiopentene dioxygenase